MLEPIALDAIVGYYLGPKIKQDMKRMCEHTNGDSGILTSIGWVDLETNQGQKPTVIHAQTVQWTASKNRNLSEETELQTSSNGSRLMGEPPYHLRKTRSVLALAVFTMKTQLLLPYVHAKRLQKPVIFGFGREERREFERDKTLCNG